MARHYSKKKSGLKKGPARSKREKDVALKRHIMSISIYQFIDESSK